MLCPARYLHLDTSIMPCLWALVRHLTRRILWVHPAKQVYEVIMEMPKWNSDSYQIACRKFAWLRREELAGRWHCYKPWQRRIASFALCQVQPVGGKDNWVIRRCNRTDKCMAKFLPTRTHSQSASAPTGFELDLNWDGRLLPSPKARENQTKRGRLGINFPPGESLKSWFAGQVWVTVKASNVPGC